MPWRQRTESYFSVESTRNTLHEYAYNFAFDDAKSGLDTEFHLNGVARGQPQPIHPEAQDRHRSRLG